MRRGGGSAVIFGIVGSTDEAYEEAEDEILPILWIPGEILIGAGQAT